MENLAYLLTEKASSYAIMAEITELMALKLRYKKISRCYLRQANRLMKGEK